MIASGEELVGIFFVIFFVNLSIYFRVLIFFVNVNEDLDGFFVDVIDDDEDGDEEQDGLLLCFITFVIFVTLFVLFLRISQIIGCLSIICLSISSFVQ